MKKYAKVGLIQGAVFLVLSVVLLLLIKKPWQITKSDITQKETTPQVITQNETAAPYENAQKETTTQVVTQNETEISITATESAKTTQIETETTQIETETTQTETEVTSVMLKVAENSLVNGVQQIGIGYVASKGVYYYNGILLYSFDIIMSDNLVLTYYTSKTIYDSVTVGTQLTVTFDTYSVQNTEIYAINSIALV